MRWYRVPKCVVEGCGRDAQGFFGDLSWDIDWAVTSDLAKWVWTCEPHRPEVETILFVEPVPDKLRPTLRMKGHLHGSSLPPLEGE